MKKLLYIFSFISLSLLGCYSSRGVATANSPSADYGNQQEVSYQTFYNDLQPYGNWIDYPGYGYVWQPNAGSDFRPYESNGQWVSTVDGWAWASNYNWGWAPFHYGRWLRDPAIGWAWVPGYEWAPAWVMWGQYENSYAWAPLAPGINAGFGNTWRAPYDYWSFVPRNYINSSNLNRYVVRNRYNAGVVNNITIINNYNAYNNHQYHAGPDYRDVEQQTHHVIRPVRIANTNRSGPTRVSGNAFEIYRPQVAANANGLAAPTPGRVRQMGEFNTGTNNTPVNNGLNNNGNPVRRYSPGAENGGRRDVSPTTQPPAMQPATTPPATNAFENPQPANPVNPVRDSRFPADNSPYRSNDNNRRYSRPDRVNDNGQSTNPTTPNAQRRMMRDNSSPANTPPATIPQAGYRNNRGFDRGQQMRQQQPANTQYRTPRPQQPFTPQRVERPQQPQRMMQRPMQSAPAQQRSGAEAVPRRVERVRQ